MKKIGVIALLMGLFILPLTLSAQMNEIPFFDSKGNVNIATTELDTLADTIAVTQHRRDDIVWSRVVYRVIDMRDKQNYQLYFPTRPNKEYRNLFTVMIDAICDGVNVYKKILAILNPNLMNYWKEKNYQELLLLMKTRPATLFRLIRLLSKGHSIIIAICSMCATS
jgi:hypothetical protein